MVKTKKEQAYQAILFYVTQKGGELQATNEIREAYKRGELSKKQAHDLRQQVEEACRSKSLTASSDVIQELDKKVKEAARFYLNLSNTNRYFAGISGNIARLLND